MRALLIQHGCEAALEGDDCNGGLVKARDFVHDKIVLDLSNIEVKFEDEDLALLLLTSLPASYEHFVDTLLYEGEELTLDVTATLNSKEIKERYKAKGDDGEGLYVRRRTNRRDSRDDGDERTGSARLDHRFRMFIPHDTQSGKVKVINGSKVFLFGIQRDNCVYSLDGHAMTGELNASVEEKDSLAQVESLGDKRYFLSIIDDYSKRVWVYILRFKHEAFGKFKEWKRLVGNQTGRTVKKLRTDNGLELCNQEFNHLCVESGIARHLTVIGTPQQNGLAERMNRTLMDKVCCLLIQSGLCKTFWVKATCTTAYLMNRSPSTTIEKKTPIEMWSGHPSDYGMLRIFGCVAYPHDKQGKLELRAIKCVLFGYPEGVKGYRLYKLDDESPKIITSGNVVFNESVMYKDTLKDSSVGTDKFVDELQDREPRTKMKHLRFQDESNMVAYAFVAGEEEDTHEWLTYEEAVACEDSSKQKLVSCKCLFKIKERIEGVQNPRYKARLVARRFTQRAGIDYNESPRKWYMRFDEYMLSSGFKYSSYNNCVYYRSYAPGEYIYLLLYIDDMLIAYKSKAEIRSTKSLLKKEFDMKELKEENKILGMEIVRDRSHKIIRVSQSSATIRGGSFNYKAEYIALTKAVKEAIWLRRLLEELGVELNTVLEAKTVKVLKVGIEHNAADALTKVIVNLLSGFQKQFPPTNNQLKTSTNPMTHATIQAGQIITESVQRRALGNKGKQVATESQGKARICYNCHGEGHVARQCREKKRAKDSQWFKDKALLMEAKEKGDVLDAEAKAFLADVECTVPYVESLAITTTTAFEVIYEDAYDFDVDEAPHVAAVFMANLMQTDDLRSQLVVHIKANEEHSFANESLKAELERYKTQVQNLEQSKVKRDLEQLVFKHKKQNVDLEEQLVSLKQQLSQHVESNKHLKTKSKKLKANKNALEESYIEELVCLRNTNKVSIELLQLYGQHVQIVPMLTKRPTFATKYLHKTILSHRNPRYLKSAQLSRLALYLGDVIVDPLHTPFKVHDSEDTLVQAEVSRTKISKRMKDPKCKVSSKHVNYEKLNSFYDTFVPQKELSREQVYWLPVNEVASHNSNQSKPVTNFVRTRPAKSQVNIQLKRLKSCFLEFDKVVKDRTTPSYITDGEWRFKHTKKCFVEEIIPFYEQIKTHVKGIKDNLYKEVFEYMKIFDELDKEYDQCVINKKSLQIENKNLLIQNECLLVESVSKDICSIVLNSYIAEPMSIEARSNCIKEHSKNLELEAEILKVKQLLVEKQNRCSFIETEYQELELKFQKYKACFENPQLQGKDELIKKLKAQISNMKEVSANPNLSTLEVHALETENTQLKEELIAIRIKHDSLRDEKVSIKKRYQDLSMTKASNSNVSSGAVVLEKPKVLAPGLYAMTPKYVLPQRRNNRYVNAPLPRKEIVPLVTKTNVFVNLKFVTEASKSKSKCETRNLPARRRIFTLGDMCPLTRITKPEAVSLGKSRSITTSAPTSCSRHMTGDRSKLINFVEKFIGQFCNAGLEVAFRKHTCYIRNEDKVDLLKGSRSTNLYSISLKDMMEASPVFLLLKASSAKSWLCHIYE
nr:retrotransposon protein, putative, Ty1-copia subclass [Tanacetum cinerariifolium]